MLRSLAIRCLEGLTRLESGEPRLLVLIYHRVLPTPDPMYPYDPDVGLFRWQMTLLRQDFEVLRLSDAVGMLQRGALPARATAITFDDGFADNATLAFPVLQELGLTATFFIASGYLGSGCMFNDVVIAACRAAPEGTWATGTAEFGDIDMPKGVHRSELAYRMISRIKYLEPGYRLECAGRLLESTGAQMPTALMMTPAQVRQLDAAGMDIGAHTRSHPILAALDDDTAEREIREGAADLSAITGRDIGLFAYPNGEPGRDYGERDVRIVRRLGFRAAVNTAWGFADRATDTHQIPRVGSWGTNAWHFSGRLALARRGSRRGMQHVLEPGT